MLVAFAAIMLATLLAALDQTIVATALPQIAADLKGFEHLSWVVTAYLLASTVTVPLYGKLSDLYGRRRLFVVSISLFLAGSALCGFAQDMTQLIAFRALQGLGAGGLLPLSQAAIADLFSPRERGRYQGYIGSVWATAAVAGPAARRHAHRHRLLALDLLDQPPAGRLRARGRDAHDAPRRPHARAPDRLAGSGRAERRRLVRSCSPARGRGPTSPGRPHRCSRAFAIGALSIVVFLVVERRAPEPLLPLTLFRGRTFAVSTSAALAIGAVLFGVTIYVPVYMQGVLGASATSSGVVLIPLTFGWVAASFTSGQLISKTGRYRVYPLLGSSLVLAGCLLLTLLDADTSRRRSASAYLVVIGVGMGCMFQTFVIATQNRVDPGDLGVATAAIQFFRSMGGSLAVAILGALLIARLPIEHRPEPAHLRRRAGPRRRPRGAQRRHARRLRRVRPARGRDPRAGVPAAGARVAHQAPLRRSCTFRCPIVGEEMRTLAGCLSGRRRRRARFPSGLPRRNPPKRRPRRRPAAPWASARSSRCSRERATPRSPRCW